MRRSDRSSEGTCAAGGAQAAVRALVLSASVGHSHDAMAFALARDLRARPEVASVAVENDLSVLGAALGRLLTAGFSAHLGGGRVSYEIAYAVFAGTTPGRHVGEGALHALGGRALAATIARHQPDVVVSTYPVITSVLGALRGRGRIGCPVAAVVGPAAGLSFWAHPSIDLHMLHYAHAQREVGRLGGGAPACQVRPLVRPELFQPMGRADARAALALPAEGRIALVSGGGWGAGDISGAVRACLSLRGLQVVAVAGSNERLGAALRAEFSGDRRVLVLGFTEEMPSLLSACDVLVTSTAGLSCIEADLRGCPVIAYGFPAGHVRDHVRALRRLRLARAASDQSKLRRELEAALNGPALPPLAVEGLHSAAELTVALARSGSRLADRGERGASARLAATGDMHAPLGLRSAAAG